MVYQVKRSIVVLAALLSSTAALAEIVSGVEDRQDVSGYPCGVSLDTAQGARVGINLSDYESVWSITFWVDRHADRYQTFFDEQDLRDDEAWHDAFSEVVIGGDPFRFNESGLMVVQREDVDEESSAYFELHERHTVAAALAAMAQDGLAIPTLFDLTGTAEALSTFRTCSYAAMGLEDGERVEVDYRAEYRMIFESAFKGWIENMARADSCRQGRYDEAAIEEVVVRAADAFYPGLFDGSARQDFRERVERAMLSAALTGRVDAVADGCFMAGDMATMSRMPVDQSVESAEEMDD